MFDMNMLLIFLGLVMAPPADPPVWLMVIIGVVFIFGMFLVAMSLRHEKAKPEKVEDW